MPTPHLEVRVTRTFTSPAARVFAAWLDPENAGRWLFATETGTMVRVAIDARIGGEFAIVERREGEDVAHTGSYLEIDPPRRLTFTLRVPKYSVDVDRVSILLEPLDSGCRLELTQTMDARWADYADLARAGWAGVLDHLAACLD